MYGRVYWMKPADWAIIRLLYESGLELSPSNISQNTGYTRSWVRNRTKEMVERGVLAVDENGHPFYSLTELGEQIATEGIKGDEVEDLTALPEDCDGDADA